MPETTLTIVLGGDVPLDLFAKSMVRFQRLVDALTSEVGGEANIAWIVDELVAGNAVATIRGEGEETENIARVVHAYATVGRALERHERIPFSPRVADAAYKLTSVLNGKITSIRFETESEEATVTTTAPDQTRVAFGAVEGRVETVRSRHRLSFTLNDSLNDQAVYCLLRLDQGELVRDAWGRRVVVEGWIKREPTTGLPVEINPVERIDLLPEVAAGSYKRARAVAPAPPDALSSDVVISRLRDA